jgi:hypothetical protein
VRTEYAEYPEVLAMHDALDIRTAPRCKAVAIATVRAHRRTRRPPGPAVFPREAFDDWEATGDRALAPA